MQKDKVTIKDVARMAGVSITTVSRVINKNYPVKEKTKIKVYEAIDELQFQPNLLAKSLIQDKTHTLGILVPSIENLFFSEVVKGIDDKTPDYQNFLAQTKGNPELELNAVNSLMHRSVDGLIVIDPRTENIKSGFYEEISQELPIIIINGYSDGVACNFVLNEDEVGTLQALEHFRESGKRNILFIRGGDSHSYALKEKLYRRFCQEKGYKAEILRIDEGNAIDTVRQAKECMQERLKKSETLSEPRPDAVLACNDFMGVGVLHAAKEFKLKIPEELSVIGFDNTVISQITDPALSTVDHHMKELGETAAREIIRRIDQEKGKEKLPFSKIYVSTALLLRES